MKRVLSILLILILTAGLCLFAGCGAKDGPEDNSAGPEKAQTTGAALADDSSATDGGIAESGDTNADANANVKADSEKPSAEGGQDAYLTDPVPVGKPAPIEPQNAEQNKKIAYHCTISIVCGTILDNMEDLTAGKEEIVPEDGVILAATELEFYEGESAFDALLRATKDNKIHMEFVSTPIYNSNYIEGIHNLYEMDCGPLSGWMYKVDDWFPNYGCSRYALEDGDVIEWIYTCDLGRDIGGGFYEQRDAQ